MRVILLVFLSTLITDSARAQLTLTVPKLSYERCTKSKELGACYELAELYVNSKSEDNIALGKKYLLYGCQLDSGKECTLNDAKKRQAEYLKNKRTFEIEKNKLLLAQPRTKSKDEVDCESGIAKACHSAGIERMYLAQPNDPKRAAELLERGCVLQHKESCSSLELIKKGLVHVYKVEN